MRPALALRAHGHVRGHPLALATGAMIILVAIDPFIGPLPLRNSPAIAIILLLPFWVGFIRDWRSARVGLAVVAVGLAVAFGFSLPVATIAAISGYCMGGAMDLALACDVRIAAPNAVFGHRGAALGILTGWGGTQRLPRLVGKALGLQMFLAAEMVSADEARRIGLVNELADDPVTAAMENAKPKG